MGEGEEMKDEICPKCRCNTLITYFRGQICGNLFCDYVYEMDQDKPLKELEAMKIEDFTVKEEKMEFIYENQDGKHKKIETIMDNLLEECKKQGIGVELQAQFRKGNTHKNFDWELPEG